MACHKALDRDRSMYGPGYGLKQLRLVSKAVRAAAQRAVQGYTIKLELRDLPTSKSDQSKVLGFLKASQLLRLRISIPTFATPAGGARSKEFLPDNICHV